MKKEVFKTRKLVSVILSLTMLMSLITAVPVRAAGVYNATAAVQYAEEHWNDGKGLCAEFVSDCLTAGGVNVNIKTTRSLRNFLVNNGYANDYLITTKQGTRIKMSDYSDKISPGDVIINYCIQCDVYPHVMLVSGTNSSGQVTYYAHNSAANNKAYWNGSDGYKSHGNGSHTFYMYILHMKNAVSEEVVHPQPVHTHSYSAKTTSAHPHAVYNVCSCGNSNFVRYDLVSSCSSCYPVGNVSLTREFEKSKGTATFYRNDVKNATSYTLEVYANNSLYGRYSMSSDTYKVTGLPSGECYAVLYAKNASTGEERSDSCNSFKIADSYTVSYNANGGSNAPSSQTKIEDETLTLSARTPSREGHIFKGWARSKNALTSEYASGSSYTKNAKVTLYAVWEPEIYTVSFDINGGTGVAESQKVTYGNTIKMPNSVVKDFAYLKGWSTNKNATKPEYKLGLDYKIKDNLTLYAVWGDATWNSEVSQSIAGKGTQEEPYLISSAADLAYLANKVNIQSSAPKYEYYKLTDNINLNYTEWMPIGIYGNEDQYFYGSFDGNGYTISDLYITKAREGYLGLFGYVKDSKIKNLTITGAIEGVTSSSGLRIGGVAGYAENSDLADLWVKYFNIGSISTSTSTNSYVGSVVGFIRGKRIQSCESHNCSINLKSGDFYTGMIGGYCEADISDCSVTSTDGGLFSTSPNVGYLSVGGLCGGLSEGSAEKCSVNAPYFSNNIKTTRETYQDSAYAGGLVGYLGAEVRVCSVLFTSENENSMTITSNKNSIDIGGIAGYSSTGARITDCKFDGKTISATTTLGTASMKVGGLVGSAKPSITSKVSVNGGQNLSIAKLPKKDGYKATWYTDSACSTPYDFSQTVTSDMTLYAKWEKGEDVIDVWDGTSKEPAYNASTKTYIITNGEELAWVADVTNGVITSGTNFPTDISFSGYTIELANDIYLNDTSNWKYGDMPEYSKTRLSMSISSNYSTPFKGRFDGKQHTIYGIYYYDLCATSGYALFGYNKGPIENVNISDAYIHISNPDTQPSMTASLVRETSSSIENCHNVSNVYIYGGEYTGGLVGDASGTSIRYCSNGSNVSIHGTGDYTGGIAGYVGSSGIVVRSYNKGSVYSESAYGKYVGGICGGIGTMARISNSSNSGYVSDAYYGAAGVCGKVGSNADVEGCYNIGSVKSNIDIAGYIEKNGEVWYCYYLNNLYGSKESSSTILYECDKLTRTQMKSLSYMSNLDSSYWATNSSINDGYPYLKELKETYKTYTISLVGADEPTINRAIVNIDGDILGSYEDGCKVGGIIGLVETWDTSIGSVKNVVVKADNVTAKSAGGSKKTAYSGSIIGLNYENAFIFNNAYYNTEMNVESSTGTIDTTGIARSSKTMNVSFYTNVMGLTPYSSLKDLDNNEQAVWVLKNNELPELYYNCLNDITISKDIENGSITVDKTQAIDGEIVTITATPADDHILNKIYVNGEEIEGTTFEVDGDCVVYATFAEEIPQYAVDITANENVSASLENVDNALPMLMSMTLYAEGDNDLLIANDGEEVRINAAPDTDYAVEAIYVNGEEIAGNSFILEKDSVVTMDVANISTDVVATTNDVKEVGYTYARITGSVNSNDSENVFYVRYWSEEDTENVYTSDVVDTVDGAGEVELDDLTPDTTYYYQVTENGEVKSFTTLSEEAAEDLVEYEGEPEEDERTPLTSTTYKKLTSTYKFTVECSQPLGTEFLAVAIYDSSDKMIDVKQIECDGDTSYNTSFPLYSSIAYAKVFVWESSNSALPIGKEEVIEITK